MEIIFPFGTYFVDVHFFHLPQERTTQAIKIQPLSLCCLPAIKNDVKLSVK
jgi:hypothetical protein